ncbi:hypothetical protein [Kitasatospora viridis]|uniref:wHTH-Hsp90 Na associated domain-containing protein n=1 Tax=Kitasatospora viridis TaxID=281105 RepID=A0A561UBC2_9ACTN|nr:hypothetical protein [Kitasatospora viridis]TWF96665.1 hypothetical protein FHX73_11437 [Kitasatospora viridis]
MSEREAGAGANLLARMLGALGGGQARPPVEPLPTDPVITSRALNGLEPRLRKRSTVPVEHLLRAAVVTGRTPGEVAQRLLELGFRPAEAPADDAVRPGDRKLISVRHDGKPGWLPLGLRVQYHEVLAAASASGTTPAQAVDRFGELGYRVAPARFPAVLQPHDLVLVSRDLDGREPWLPLDGDVKVGHLSRAAVVTGEPPAELAHRLLELGYRVPAELPTDVVRPGDRTLLSRDLDGRPPWLRPTVQVDVERLLATAVATDSTPRRVAVRFGELGYQVTKAELPGIARPHDTLLLSRDLDGGQPQLTHGQRISSGHLLRAAVVTAQKPSEVAQRMVELGFRPEEAPADDAVRPGDRELISAGHDGNPPWLRTGQPLQLGAVLVAALATNTAPRQVADRLEQLGYEVPKTGIPEQVRTVDPVLLSRDLDGRVPWLRDDMAVPGRHLLRAAIVAERLTVREAAQRLRELGHRTAAGASLDEPVRPGDRQLISDSHDGKPPWLKPGSPVQLGWLLAAASATGTGPREAAARLKQLGYDVPESGLPERVDRSDLVLASRDLNGRRPWLAHTDLVKAGHLVRVAAVTGRGIEEIALRVAELGFRVAKVAATARVLPTDRQLLSERGDGAAPWLRPGSPVPLGRILSAALAAGATPREVALRLAELGHELPGTQLPPLVEPADLVLISRHADGAAPWLPIEDVVPARHLQQAALAADRSPETVVARLRQLGYTVD